MTEPRAQQIIVLMTLITLGSTSGAELKGIKKAKNLHPSRTIVGGFFAMLGCSVLAEVAPSAGAYLSVLVGGVAFFTYGLPTIESYYEGQISSGGHPIGHPNQVIVGTKVVRNKAGGPVEVPIYQAG